MNLCVIADLHGEPNYSSQLTELEYDLLVVCGDITNFGHYKQAHTILTVLPEPYIAVHGNCDCDDVVTALTEKGCNLHQTCRNVDELFCGFGGGNVYKGRTPCEYTEKEIYNGLSSIPANCIVVTHVPPKDTNTDKSFLRHVGSTAVRQIISEKKPKIVLCGHIHESRNTDMVGETLVVNPGMFSKGFYALVDTEDKTCQLAQFR